MATQHHKPTYRPTLEGFASGNCLITPDDDQQTLINILQMTSLVRFITDAPLADIGDDALWGLQRMLGEVNTALWYQIKRHAPVTE